MNYYKALEVKGEDGNGSGIFHFTVSNDNRTMAIGYCRENRESEDLCRHKSAIEASDCYRDYCKNQQNGMMAGFKDNSERGTEIILTSSY